jgi:hypothetical protein
VDSPAPAAERAESVPRQRRQLERPDSGPGRLGPDSGPGRLGPDVILDVVFEDGLLFLVLANLGDRPALQVACRFDEPFSGLGGTQATSRLALFERVEFLPPRKEIRTLLDASAAYFARREPTKIGVTIAYRDEDGGRHERRVAHDLRIYRDIAYVARGERADF